MADVESLKQNILDTNFDYSTLGRSHFKGTRNEMEMAKNELKFNEYQSRQDKLYDLAKMELEMQYNSASAQKQRFLEAGLNPYLSMVESPQAGSISSTGSPASHGASGLASAVAAGRQADAARFNAITSAAGQLSDSVSSFYKNKIMNQQAQQEEFKTVHQAESFRVDLQNKISDLEAKKNKSDIDIQTLKALKLAYQKSLETYVEDVRTPRLQNDLLYSQFNKTKSDQQFVDAQTRTEDAMRSVRVRAAEQGIKLSKSQENQLYASAQNLASQSALYQNQARLSDFDILRISQDWNGFVNELQNKRLITEAEAAHARLNAEKAGYEFDQWKRINGYADDDDGVSIWSWILGRGNEVTKTIGQIFGGSGAAFIRK